MPGLKLPFQPFRSTLYSPDELFAALDADDPSSFVTTLDFAVYRHFVRSGRWAPQSYFESMMQSLHDNSITQALTDVLTGRKCVAIMGGHRLDRDGEDYARIAALSRALTRKGFLIASGGGPGAMEATHLGAALAGSPDEDLAAATAELSASATLPENLKDILDDAGEVNPAVVEMVHAWYAPAFRVARRIGTPGASLAVPTWHYGHEPSTPFATHLAKYFQNSIREEGMLAVATYGIVFAPGRAGTVQEIFQDAAQNYYRSFKVFSPMVLLGRAHWNGTYPVDPLLRALFRDDYAGRVLVTDDIEEAQRFIEAFQP